MLYSFGFILIEIIFLIAMLFMKRKFVLSSTSVITYIGIASLIIVFLSCFCYIEAFSPYIKMMTFMDIVLVYFLFITYRVCLSLFVFVFSKSNTECILEVKIRNRILTFINNMVIVNVFFIPLNHLFYEYNVLVIGGTIGLSCLMVYLQEKMTGIKAFLLNYINNSLIVLYAVILLLLSYNIFVFTVFELVCGVMTFIISRKGSGETAG